MSNFIRNLISFLLLLFVWVLVNNGLNITVLLSGTIVCCAILVITNVVLGFNYFKVFSLPLFKFCKYIIYMMYCVYSSGIKATYMILTGNVNPGFVKCSIDNRIKNKFLQNIIENSITLTPGTITLSNEDGELTVLILHKTKNSKNEIISGFEPYIIEMQHALNTVK